MGYRSTKEQKKVEVLIEVHSHLEFQDTKAPELQNVLMKLQALIGEEGSDYSMFHGAIDNYWINIYIASLDFAINELESRFSQNDQDILSALEFEPKARIF